MRNIVLSLVFTSLLAQILPAIAQDFGDYSSATLTGKAWEAYGANDFELALTFTAKCKEMYLATAKEQQAALDVKPTGEKVHDSWALNDVGTCLYIEGQILEKQDKVTEAIAVYKILSEELSFSQCWDTKGWFWSPAEAAADRVKQLEFDSLLD